MIAQLLFGLLLFATVLGHVANIVTSVSAARKEFQGELMHEHVHIYAVRISFVCLHDIFDRYFQI